MPTDPAVVMDGGGLVRGTSSTSSITITYYLQILQVHLVFEVTP